MPFVFNLYAWAFALAYTGAMVWLFRLITRKPKPKARIDPAVTELYRRLQELEKAVTPFQQHPDWPRTAPKAGYQKGNHQ